MAVAAVSKRVSSVSVQGFQRKKAPVLWDGGCVEFHSQAKRSSHTSNILFRRWKKKKIQVQVRIYLFPGINSPKLLTFLRKVHSLEWEPGLKCTVWLNLSVIYNIDLIFTWQRTCWLFLDVHVRPHNRENRVCIITLFLAVTRSSKFWSLTCVSAVKTFHFCHFCNSSLSTENAEEWVTAVKIYSSLCTNRGKWEKMFIRRRNISKTGGLLPQGCKHLRQ